MALTLERMGIEVEVHHHEVGGPGQAEIDLRFQPLVRMADVMQLYKYVARNVARQAGKVVTFMPKPIFEENGSGMHTHMSLWKDGETIMFDAGGYALISETARHYVGGLLAHAPALLAFCAPTTNSYKRLVPGYEAPVSLLYSKRNRSAAVRIPVYFTSPKAKRVEFRSPDPSANPYLAFAALLMAGLDGIERGLEPPEPVDENLYALRPSARRRSSRSRRRWTACSTRSRPTTTSCSRATCSRPTCWRPTSSTSAARSTRSGCARTPGSSRCYLDA